MLYRIYLYCGTVPCFLQCPARILGVHYTTYNPNAAALRYSHSGLPIEDDPCNFAISSIFFWVAKRRKKFDRNDVRHILV